MYDDGVWTVVRYGKRQGRRPPQYPLRPRPPGGRQQQWGKVRAPPSSNLGGRDSYIKPNRPVPPPRPFWRPRPGRQYLGPQSRSFASVVKQSNWGKPPNWTRPNTPYTNQYGGWKDQEPRSQYKGPPGRKLGLQIRQMHRVIKVVHHLQNVALHPEQETPKMIARMIDNLATAIRPASPTPATIDKIVGNAKHWGHTTMQILEEHYENELATLQAELPEYLDENWPHAFKIATGWAKKNLQRLSQDVVDHVEALIASCFQPSGSTKTTQGDKTTTEEPQRDAPPVPLPRTHPRRKIDIGGPDQRVQTPKKDTGTMTDQKSDWSPDLPSQPSSVVIIPQTPQPLSPKEQRPQGERGVTQIGSTTKTPSLGNASRQDLQEPDIVSLLDEEPVKILDPTARFWEAMKMTPVRRTNTVVVQAQVHQQEDKEKVKEPPDPPKKGPESPTPKPTALPSTTPPPKYFKPTRHLNTNRKLVDWKLTAHKKWVMIGDSNLARFPEYVIPHLQVESYPGANFRHAKAIISSAISQVVVEKVVLAFGLNCRDQKVQETSLKNLRAAFTATQKTFPFAEIWFPLINFSEQLKHKEQKTLRDLNTQIEIHVPFIPLLPKEEFQTGPDHIHWTKLTAEKMLDHWTRFLNMGAP